MRFSGRQIIATLRALALAAAACSPLAAHAAEIEGRGQDFPFFCRMDEERSFRVVDDADSDSGFTLVMYDYGQYDGEMPVGISLSDDGHHWVIYGREHLGPFRDRQILAYINKSADDGSHADVRTTLRNVDPVFELQPIACGAAAE
jgi:hypothetical protein